MEAGLLGVFEKKRGVAGQASGQSPTPPRNGRRRVSLRAQLPRTGQLVPYFPVQRLSPAAEFEHLAQHGDFPLCRDIPKHVQHSAGRVGIRVVAIVENLDTVARDSLPAHLAGRKRRTASRVSQPVIPNRPATAMPARIFRIACRPCRELSNSTPSTRKRTPSAEVLHQSPATSP